MKPEEAIDVLERERNKSHWDSLDELKQASDAWNMAIEALEKQIPKKIVSKEDYADCPKCGTIQRYRKEFHCYHCGQKILWSDENDKG